MDWWNLHAPSFRLRSSYPLGFHQQQHDPADERERARDRRDKVAVGGLNMHADEIERLSRGVESDARVSEHDNAESDQSSDKSGDLSDS